MRDSLLLDGGNEDPDINLKKVMFWPDNIIELFQKFEVLKHFDFLSVDMDSYDWFMLEKILEAGYEPRVVIIEANTMFDLADSKTILPPALPGQTWKMWDGTSYQVLGLLGIWNTGLFGGQNRDRQTEKRFSTNGPRGCTMYLSE